MRWVSRYIIGPWLAFSCSCGAPAGAAGSDSDALRAVAAERLQPGERIVLDGRLDEAVWQRAQVAGGFIQNEPEEGQPATEPTEVRIAYDADTLYLGVHLHDSVPGRILGRQRERDGELNADDMFSVVLDTFGDGRTGYLFETNPAGVLNDALLGDGDANDSWDGVWDVRTRRSDAGWLAEFAVPFRTLNFDPARSTWAINFQRTVRRVNEDSLWSGFRRTQGLMRTVYAGRVSGFAGLSQGRGLEVEPYASVRHTEIMGRASETDTNLGFDLTYSITPNLRAALTVNTDFADTEVDERELNLGRFPIRFPEKRDFFLEGSAVYAFPGEEDVTPFYSRRIGLSRDGPVPIAWGGRLAGQVGRFDLAALHLNTKAAFGRDGEHFTVLRTRAAIAEDSYAGVLYTRRAGHEPRAQHTVGLDADVRVADFGDGSTIGLRPYGVWTSQPAGDAGSSDRDRAMFGLEASGQWRNGDAFIEWHETGEAYDPAVGFAFDTGYRALGLGLTFDYQPRSDFVQEIDHEIEFDRRTTLSGELIETSGEIGLFEAEFASGDVVGLALEWEAERLDESFDIWEDIIVPAGRYEGWGWSMQVETAERRPWAAELGFARGEFFGGRRNRYDVALTVRPWAGVTVSLGAEQEDVNLPGGRFTTRQWTGRFAWSFTTRHALNLLGQYDNESDSVGLQVRFRWTLRPGSEVFLGYLHDWAEEIDLLDGRSRWRSLGRESAVKGSYTWWF